MKTIKGNRISKEVQKKVSDIVDRHKKIEDSSNKSINNNNVVLKFSKFHMPT